MLKQGFRAAVARTPVFINNVSADEWFGWVPLFEAEAEALRSRGSAALRVP